MAEREEGPTLGELEEVVAADPGPESVVDSVREAMEAAEAPEAEAAAEAPENVEGEEGTEPKETPEAEPESEDGRERDEKGRFVAKDGTPEEAAEATPEVEPVEPVADPAQAAATEDEPLDPRPEWTLEKQEAFRALPVEAQRILLEETDQLTTVQQ